MPNGSRKLCNRNNIYIWTKTKVPHNKTYVASAERYKRKFTTLNIHTRKLKLEINEPVVAHFKDEALIFASSMNFLRTQ